VREYDEAAVIRPA